MKRVRAPRPRKTQMVPLLDGSVLADDVKSVARGKRWPIKLMKPGDAFGCTGHPDGKGRWHGDIHSVRTLLAVRKRGEPGFTYKTENLSAGHFIATCVTVGSKKPKPK